LTEFGKITLSGSATADMDTAPANIGNLVGFLDAFKAVSGPVWLGNRPAAVNAASLTHCEDFA